MKTVFLGGSRQISRLNDVIRRRLEEIVRRQMHVVVGDANGADRALQRQLAEWRYPAVTVYFVGKQPRNNEGGWPTREIATPSGLRGAEFYAVKDRQMTGDAEYGFMLWDAKSRGTLANIERLVEEKKPVAVYLGPARKVINVKSPAELEGLRSMTRAEGLATRATAKQEELGLEAVGALTTQGFSSRKMRVREQHGGVWGSHSQDFARLANLLYEHSAAYAKRIDGNSSIYTLAGIPVLFSALRCLLVELNSGIFGNLADDRQALDELANSASEVRLIVRRYELPDAIRGRLALLEQVRHEILHPAHRPGEEESGTPAYLNTLKEQGLLQTTGHESDYTWITQLQSHKLFRWAFETIAETVMLLLQRHSASAFALQGLAQTYGRFRSLDEQPQEFDSISTARGDPWPP